MWPPLWKVTFGTRRETLLNIGFSALWPSLPLCPLFLFNMLLRAQNHRILCVNIIRKIMKNFKPLSNVLNKNKGHSGRLGHSALKPIFNSVSVRVPKITFQRGGHIEHDFY